MELQLRHIKAILRSGLVDHEFPTGDAIYDAAYDALLNHAPVVRTWTVEQDKGAYYVHVRGVSGVYYVEALERDEQGPFETIEQAEAAVYGNFYDLIIDAR